jgi:amidase
MGRSAADLALALPVLAGPDEEWDGIGYRLVLPPPRHDRVGDYRVLVLDRHPLCPTAESVRAALNGLADRLGGLGCTIRRGHPNLPDLAATTRNYCELLAASFSVDLTPETRLRREAAASALSPDDLTITAAWLRGTAMSQAAWSKTSRIRAGLRTRWQAVFGDVDVLLCPPMPTPAFAHDHAPHEARKATIDGHIVDYDDQVAWCALATPTGLPATVAPIAHSPDGLPIGVQIVGGYLNDLTTIAFAGHIEQAFGGFVPPPNLS